MAPHIRAANSLARINRLRALALAPVLLAAVVNTGYQYLLAVDVAGGKLPGGWHDDAVGALGIDYRAPGVLGVVVVGLIHVLPVLLAAVLAGGLWERVFCDWRRRRFDLLGVVLTALVFTLLMPPAASLAQVAFGMSFAVIFGSAVFGGEGKSFLNPALLGAAVMQISFPVTLTADPLWTTIAGYGGTKAFGVYHQQGIGGLAWMGIDWWHAFLGTTQGMIGTTSVLAVLLGGALLVYARIASWRLVAGAMSGLVLAALLCNRLGGGILALPWYWHLVLGGFAFGVVFVATDPSSAAATDSGRWLQGLLIGALAVMVRVVNPSHPDGVIPALLLASLLAPLIDHVVIWLNVRRRRLRHG